MISVVIHRDTTSFGWRATLVGFILSEIELWHFGGALGKRKRSAAVVKLGCSLPISKRGKPKSGGGDGMSGDIGSYFGRFLFDQKNTNVSVKQVLHLERLSNVEGKLISSGHEIIRELL